MLAPLDDHPVLSVSDLSRQARILIEERFNLVWVEGEVSNFRRPASGHWYFTLKDDRAQLRCAMFASRNHAVRKPPAEGDQVVVRGRVSLYEPRGDFQIIADQMEPAGEGALRAAFEALKARLDAEGLFDPERKRTLPHVPRRLAIVPSPSGAALQDVLHVLRRRFPALQVTLVPARVQGEGAERDIIEALRRAVEQQPDVVLLTRGGGSLEDLWTFNLESVARTVADSPVPIVVAVGHQTDFTIAEFAADLRAPTPSAAAELITPSSAELTDVLAQLRYRVLRAFAGNQQLRAERLRRLRAQLWDPRQQLAHTAQRIDELDERLRLAAHNRLLRSGTHLHGLTRALRAHRPEPRIAKHRESTHAYGARLARAMSATLERSTQNWQAAARTLQAVSPLHTIGRGYSVLSQGTGQWVTSIDQAQPGTSLTAHLHDGALELQVNDRSEDNRLPKLPPLESN